VIDKKLTFATPRVLIMKQYMYAAGHWHVALAAMPANWLCTCLLVAS
jgi:hypothetical protein